MKTIIILDKQTEYQKIIKDLKKYQNYRIITIDNEIHEILQENKIKHILGDSIIKSEERLRIHEKSFEYINWYNNLESKEFEFEGYNLLKMIDENEFQVLITNKLSKLFHVKNIIESENPDKIITTVNIADITKVLRIKQDIELISDIRNDEKLFFDTIEIKFDSKIFPKNIILSRSKYFWIKNFIEKVVTRVYNLKYDKNERQSVLFLEFNPELYEELLMEVEKSGKQSVLINTRRSSVWSKKSINALKKSKSKIIILDEMLNDKDKKLILVKSKIFKENFLKFFKNDNIIREIFSIDKFSFWDIIKTEIVNMYLNRIHEKLSYILIANRLHEEKKFDAIISLNLSGEAEKIFLEKNDSLSVLLQHAFGNYSKGIRSLELTDDLHLIKGKIAVWGDVMKNYLLENNYALEKDIIVSGSPRHDSFFVSKIHNQNNSKVLLTPRPIIHDIDGQNTRKYEEYENTIRKIVTSIKKNNLELIVKLHPQKNPHNEKIREIINSIDPNIEVFQTKRIFDLIKDCSIMINLSSDNYDASTTIMEGMVMKKPVIDISLVKERYDFVFLEKNAINYLHSSDDIEKSIMSILANKEKQDELIERSQKFLGEYLANQGNASKILAQELSNIN